MTEISKFFKTAIHLNSSNYCSINVTIGNRCKFTGIEVLSEPVKL